MGGRVLPQGEELAEDLRWGDVLWGGGTPWPRQLLQWCRATLPLSMSVPCPVQTAFCPPKLIPTHPGLGFTALVETLGHLKDTKNLTKTRTHLREMKPESLWWVGLRYWHGF